MREFNDYEKKVITSLVEAGRTKDIVNLCVANYIMKATGCYAIEWITNTGFEKVDFYCKDKDTQISVIFGGLDILSLLKYLEDNGYILVMQKANAIQLPKQLYRRKEYIYEDGTYWINMGNGCKGAVLGSKQTLYTNVALLLDKYAHAIIYPTTELEQYVKRKFKTKEDIKFRKQQHISWIGIIIALLSSIYAIYQSTLPITIDDIQFNQIVENIKESKTEMPNIVDVQIVNDTLGVNIKESVRLDIRSHITNIPTLQ